MEHFLNHRMLKLVEIDTQQSSQGPLTSQERLELQQLRRDLKRAEMERDFLRQVL